MHNKSILLTIIALTVYKITIIFFDGYYVSIGILPLLSLLITESTRYILIGLCLISIIKLILKYKVEWGFTLTIITLTLIGLIPTGHFRTLGALASVYNSNPIQIRDDARMLMNSYESNTHFSDFPNQRHPFNTPVPKDKLPQSLQNLPIADVLVLENYVYLEKQGLSGLFRGFVVFREGKDIWVNQNPIIFQKGCNYCWKIRIVDGLYWYHAIPTDEEITTVFLPLK